MSTSSLPQGNTPSLINGNITAAEGVRMRFERKYRPFQCKRINRAQTFSFCGTYLHFAMLTFSTKITFYCYFHHDGQVFGLYCWFLPVNWKFNDKTSKVKITTFYFDTNHNIKLIFSPPKRKKKRKQITE